MVSSTRPSAEPFTSHRPERWCMPRVPPTSACDRLTERIEARGTVSLKSPICARIWSGPASTPDLPRPPARTVFVTALIGPSPASLIANHVVSIPRSGSSAWRSRVPTDTRSFGPSERALMCALSFAAICGLSLSPAVTNRDPASSRELIRQLPGVALRPAHGVTCSIQQARPVRACHPLQHAAGELLDPGWQGDIAAGGGVGLASVGEPVEQADEGLAAGLAGLVGVDERPAVAGDGVAAGPGLADDREVGRGDVRFLGGVSGNGLGGWQDVPAGLVADGGGRQEQAVGIGLFQVADGPWGAVDR